MRSTFAFLCVLLAGCGGPAPQSDGGPRQDAGTDGGSATQCTRVSDCASSAPCTTARCEPGNPMADARGCIVVSACAEDEVCQDDRCVPQCDVFDADADGHDADACAGDDCDDNDARRYPGNPTICDVDNHDEDCRMDTLGPDLDADGFQSAACCELWATNVLCGADCDDGDPAVNPSRPELCNGVDDDCDGAVDDGFDCIQNQVLTGDDGCGREGQRRCSETCTWLDDALVRSEDSTTCDYCPDAGDDLASEVPFAMTTASYPLWAGSLLGTATCLRSGIGWGSCLRTRLILNTQADQAGAAHLYRVSGGPVRIGYEELVISVDGEVTTSAGVPPGRGWALWLLEPSTTTPTLGAASDLGEPPSSAGWAVEVRFDDPSMGSYLGRADWDTVSIRRLGESAPLHTASFMVNDVNETTVAQTVTQTLTIRIRPDLPWTSSDETRVSASFASVLSGIPENVALCAGSACHATITPGSEIVLGISAATDAAASGVATIVVGPTSGTAMLTASAPAMCP